MTNRRLFVSAAVLAAILGVYAHGQTPPAKLELYLPEYEVTRQDSLDYVQIPGGQMLAEEEGRPLVPYYVEYLDYPQGYRVQDVVLKKRSPAETATGLKLPAVILSYYRKEPVTMKPGLYPDRDHAWRVAEMPEGGTMLAVAVYPFDYDPQTTNVTYCRSYEFDIKYDTSSIALTLTADKHSYAPGETLRLRLAINNAGGDQNVTVAASLVNAATGVVAKKLPARTLAARADTSSATLDLPIRSISNGDYYADVTISGPEGEVLEKKQVSLRIGIPEGKLTGLEVLPQYFKIGDVVKFSLGFANTGSTTLSGQAVFEVRLRDSVVADLRHDFKDLAPGKSRQFSDSWKTASARENVLYSVVGFVSYEATATMAERVVISTNAMPSAEFTVAPDTLKAGQEVTFDAGGSKDADGTVVKYQWEFGDGGDGEGVIVSHVYPEAGEFVVTLIVTDNGGRTTTVEKRLAVSE